MHQEGRAVSSQALLADLGWMRALARALASGHADADDLVQDTWLAAATHPPRDVGALRPWLRRVLGNLVVCKERSAVRRTRRESASASDGLAQPADELLARAQLQHAVASFVLALDEPFRSTVLLRYFEGLSAAEIGRRQRVPAATVRWRLSRGLARLRVRLDERAGGDRRAWALLLVPAPGRVGPWLKGAFLMTGAFKLASIPVVLLLLLAVGAGIWSARRSPPSSAAPAAPAAPAVVPPASRALAPPPPALPGWFGQPGVPPRPVAGRVLYDERPVGGALVELADVLTDTGAMARQTRRTDAEGRFDFGLQVAARREIVASAPGLTPSVASLLLENPVAQPPPDELVLRLGDCDGLIHGVVKDVSGGPVADARVCLAPGGVPRACTVTDASGRYQLCLERNASRTLHVGASGYGAMVERIHPHAARLRRDFALVPHAVFAGRVVRDSDGQPVSGAQVWAEPTVARGAPRAVTLSDEHGRFVLQGLAPGHYQIGASSGELASLQPADVVSDGGRTRWDLTLRLQDTATVSGVVVSDGQPVAGARLQVTSQWLSSSLAPHAVSQRDGTFVLRGVGRGLNELRVHTHELLAPRIINVVDGVLGGLRVEVARPAILRGRVLRAGRPVPGAHVVAGGLDTHTGENGAFALAGLRAGSHAVTATTRGARATARVQLRTGELTEVELTMASAAISGVLVEEDGRPAPGLIVVFSQAHGADFSMGTSAEDGSFTVAGLAGGDTYRARVQADLGLPVKLLPAPGLAFPEVTVADREAQVRGVKLVVRRDHQTISGVVVDAAGGPRADVEVAAVPLDGQGAGRFDQARPYPRATTAVDGSFAIHDLDRGSFLLHAQAGDGPEIELAGVRSGARDVRLRLPPTGAIRGALIGFASPPDVLATPVGRSQRQRRAIVTGQAFTLGDLTPGEYTVAALTDAGDAVRVKVVGGAVTEATLTARGKATVRGGVLELSTRAPVAGLTCGVLLGGASADPRLRLPGGVLTDQQGRFELTAPVGRPTIECRDPTGRISNGAAPVVLAPEGAEVEIPVVQPRLPRPMIGKLIGVDLQPALFGARLVSVVPRGPAERAGLRAGDTVLAVDGRSVAGLTQTAIVMLVYDRPVGATAALRVARGERTIPASVTVAAPGD